MAADSSRDSRLQILISLLLVRLYRPWSPAQDCCASLPVSAGPPLGEREESGEEQGIELHGRDRSLVAEARTCSVVRAILQENAIMHSKLRRGLI